MSEEDDFLDEPESSLLEVDESRAGEEVTVQNTESAELFDAYVDDDGTVRVEENGAAFNEYVYTIV